ncbi:MAG: imidazole glycerol phosphate synthase subunit HisH [Ignavibacteriaceae bacterium]
MIALIDYGAGNVASVANALTEIEESFIITKNETEIIRSDKIIFPGVGEASFAIKQLHISNLFSMMRMCRKPLLGICLGLQLMAQKSEEGDVACLGIFPGTVIKFDQKNVKVPHMGWNDIKVIKKNKLFSRIKNGERFYFANSYYLPTNNFTTSQAEYDVEFSASVEKDNYYAVQFHPEKSGNAGLQLLKNFAEIC